MILVTGATGMVGRQVAELLLDRGTPVTALVRDPSRAAWLTQQGARVITGDIASAATWDAVDSVAGVVHCAAVISGGGSWEAYAGTNIRATTLAAARARTLGVPLVQISSVAVYGGASTAPVGSVDEAYPFAPLERGNWYGRSKRESELAVWREAEKGLRAIALRPCVIYGPHDRHFFPGILKRVRAGRLPLIGAGDRPMALVHARSVAEAALAALDAKHGWGRPYNVTGDGKVAPREVLAALLRGIGRPIRIRHLPERPLIALARAADFFARFLLPAGTLPGTITTGVAYWRGGDPYRSDAIRSELGWSPTIDHAAEIERLAALK